MSTTFFKIEKEKKYYSQEKEKRKKTTTGQNELETNLQSSKTFEIDINALLCDIVLHS